jgi:hypothetical protein
MRNQVSFWPAPTQDLPICGHEGRLAIAVWVKRDCQPRHHGLSQRDQQAMMRYSVASRRAYMPEIQSYGEKALVP